MQSEKEFIQYINNCSIFEINKKNILGNTILMEALMSFTISENGLMAILERKPNVNVMNNNCDTPLSLALINYSGNITEKVILKILDLNADINIQIWSCNLTSMKLVMSDTSISKTVMNKMLGMLSNNVDNIDFKSLKIN